MPHLDDHALAAALPGLLSLWGLEGLTVQPLGGGMNSATAVVGESEWVAKWVPEPAAADLVAGAEVAARLAACGLETGQARRTVTGDLTVRLGEGVVTLMRFVHGRSLTGSTPQEQRRMAATLARVHGLATGVEPDRFPRWWDRPRAELPPYLTEITGELAEAVRASSLTWCDLHTDPAPEAFIDMFGADTALLDWAGSCRGPALYDIASAVMYLGGRETATPFLSAYRAERVVPDAELDQHFDLLWRVRGAVQAVYFSERLALDDLTGVEGRRENERGRDHGLAMLGVLD